MKTTTNLGLKKIELTDSPPDITVQDANWDSIDKHLNTAVKFQKAGGTGTAITLTEVTLEDGYQKTFIVTANNSSVATKINGKNLYKPGGTAAPNLISGKAVTVWYDLAGDCFFIKASAEGDAVAANVLAGKKFSNDNETGISGTMVNNGPSTAETINLTSNNQEYTIAAGFHSGLRKIKAVITNLAAGVIKAGTTVGGILGTFTSDANAVAGDIIVDKTAYVNGNKVTGSIAIINPDVGDQIPAIGISPALGYAFLKIPINAYYRNINWVRSEQPDLQQPNILAGKSILGVEGTLVLGKKSASGSVVSTTATATFYYTDGSTGNFGKVVVNGLTFLPSFIIVYFDNGPNQQGLSIYHKINYQSGTYPNVVQVSRYDANSLSDTTYNLKADAGGNAYVNANGFSLPVAYANGLTCKWVAYE